jgi:putative endonuclease
MAFPFGKNGGSTRERGNIAEQMAVDYLTNQGYEIVERNFMCKVGEIDIIARHRGDLVFVEVRSRHSPQALNPVYSVNRGKQNRIIRAAHVFLDRHFSHSTPSRFDVVLVTLGNPPQVELIPDAFMADW